WTSSRPDIINPQTGNITRPSRTEEDAVVTLEALIKKGAAAASRTFELTVPRSDSAQLGIAFTENDYSLQVGQTKPTVVTATYEGASQVVIADGIVYTMADPTVAQVSADGSISGVSQGETVISAVYNGFAAQAAIHVKAGDTPEAPQLSGLSFSKPEYTIMNGESLNAQVAAVY
ncbi:Ig-like domain-containing protein, partial [Paenibacillus sepulcri]|nr:Ig-like domain-containing protein [Paenibacillus sepulcri]